ncbi:uracil-DNA glycosylase family protein [Shewanella sp. D64]|uniref:uracil-DNA glycosylase family protein n=1 Tax=unclassified Shewanella TaxID=196818 RepID=UPI0022BA2B69|nr:MULTISPECIES: uracil-DNA glycosylase family protein [unclassified Shewanella]MEC4728336.1 uracil-DNA glycosylase family protein [Shewanella sp. D64]MEC4737330.1 uracil-DNA glycosylase family protein [Shewanella sp. E94]WBJ93706.1 uracil-DNA glycosylase family protein [Shewanella sp. MTB7]
MSTDNLPALITQISACQLCQAELPLPAKPIIQISAESKILIVGQAPGIRAHNHGRAFSDPSGDRLRLWLGVSEAQFYDPKLFAILPMGFCFPGTIITSGKKSGDKPPLKRCAATWRQTLLNQLSHVELTIILGQYAIDYHLGKSTSGGKLTVTQAVSQWQEYWPQHMVLPHPSPRNNLYLKKHPECEQILLPALKTRVAQLIGPH